MDINPCRAGIEFHNTASPFLLPWVHRHWSVVNFSEILYE